MKKRTRIAAMTLLLCGLAFCMSGCQNGGDTEPTPEKTEIQNEKQTEVRLVALNIGKADCMLLIWEDHTYLIDTGYTQTSTALEYALKQYGVTRLDGVFLTHCHKDHYGALYYLRNTFDVQVDAWYAPAIYFDMNGDYHPYVINAGLSMEDVTWLNAGDVIDAGGGYTFTVLGPLSVNTENENNNSLVMRFSSPDGSILFAGDMKEEEEAELLAANAFTACDVLKVGHHGDNKATTAAMLDIVRPKAALILTDSAEEPDTPANATLKRLNAVGCKAYVSQDYSDAMLVTLRKGEVTVEDVHWDGVPAAAQGLTLEMDLSDDLITIRNEGSETVQLYLYLLYSSQGDEMVRLPEWELKPGEEVTVGTKTTKAAADITWNAKKVWGQKKRDVAILYDTYGRGVARTDNGIAE